MTSSTREAATDQLRDGWWKALLDFSEPGPWICVCPVCHETVARTGRSVESEDQLVAHLKAAHDLPIDDRHDLHLRAMEALRIRPEDFAATG